MNSNSPQITEEGKSGRRGNGSAESLWLGYAPTGGRIYLRHDELKRKLLVAGHSSDSIASLLAYACYEVGLKVLILDTDGHLTERVSGYFETYDYTCFLYDAFQLEEDEGARHSQLISAAYTAALDLNAEEEAIVNAAMHQLAMRDTMASPAVLFDALGSVEGFRGFYVDKLKGRVGGLKFLESTENGSLMTLMSLASSLVTFKSARYPQAVEVAVAIFIAKLLVMLQNAKTRPDILIMNDVHKIFKANPRPKHASRLLTELLDAPITVVLVSDQNTSLSQVVQDAFPLKILSSEVWNEGIEGRWKANTREPILPNACIIADGHYGHQRAFIPRSFEIKTAEPRTGPGVVARLKGADNELTTLILTDIKRYDAPTRASLIAFLSAEYDSEVIKHELDRLHEQALIKLESKAVRKGGDPMLVYTLTEAGERILEALSS